MEILLSNPLERAVQEILKVPAVSTAELFVVGLPDSSSIVSVVLLDGLVPLLGRIEEEDRQESRRSEVVFR